MTIWIDRAVSPLTSRLAPLAVGLSPGGEAKDVPPFTSPRPCGAWLRHDSCAGEGASTNGGAA
jgi:hypothetical protein